ncbi:DUF4340 domain-containing protein [Seongchinamella sediminis]|uniref:DUF4340 domain-containing protein n=1 Tax=Seongchinamella sediminis TaxID=2283635 RepID=A0A3L7E3D3_9GAMM|nr:DUF4340 domain-containing protein [Seongchinamella sediminis]RLQ23425.1 DUF4340 domain-containing protein [Seongchinamella sediminis]
MNRTGIVLGALLVAQLFLTMVLYRADDTGSAGPGKQALLATDAYVIDELRVEDGSGGVVQLQKSGDLWQLPQLSGLPADPEKVAEVLQKLTAGDPGWAVAHTLAARQRFQVADYHYRRKVTLASLGQTVGTVYLGTSPGFRKVHARNELGDGIYSLDLNLFDLPVEAGQWLEPRLLQVRAPVAINADGYSLQRRDGEWQLGTGETPEQRELQALLDALRNLQVLGVASAQQQQAAQREEAALILDITALAGNTRLELFRLGEDYYAASSEYPQLFRISAYDFDKLTGIDSLLLSGAQ